jgi:ribosomal protein S18 acetylase RimI-like enzyme
MIRILNIQDFETWINLAKEVEPLFGPMVDLKEFKDGIKESIKNNDSYGIENGNGELAGIIALDQIKNEILWLAVSEKHRGNNYGNRLVKKAIEILENKGDIFVQTFAENIKEGNAARKIYENNGFTYLKNAGQNPAGIETVIMVKKNKSNTVKKVTLNI